MIEQGTPEWLAVRAGKITGSRFADAMARNKKGEPLKAFDDLVWQIVVERITGQPVEGPTGYALQWGSDVEPFAREAYELETGAIVEQVGFVAHPDHPFVGSSPDGLVGADGGIEIKCPKNPAVHLQRFIDGVPSEYLPQIHGNIWVTGRQWWDFVSFDPRFPEPYRLLRIRVVRDEAQIKAIEKCVLEAEALTKQILERLEVK